MSVQSDDNKDHVRLNPFAFPADTDLRFVLLVVMIVAASTFAFNWMHLRLSGDEIVRLFEACPDQSSQGTAACFKPNQQAGGVMAIEGVLVMGAFAIGLYWVMPAWKLRRDRLAPLSREDVPEVVDELAALSAEAGLQQTPVFVWSPLNMSITGQAFGRVHQKYVMLTGGLVAAYYTDRATFRAIVRHELAHLSNGDVDKTYLVITAWIAFVAIALLPFALVLLEGLVRGQSISSVLGQTFAFGGLALLVFITRNSVLQAREVYADVRASVVDGPHGALLSVLSALPQSQGGWLRRALGTHPSPEERVSAIERPDKLFQIRLFDVFLTGVAGSIAFWNVMNVAGQLLPLRTEVFGGMFASLIFAPLVAGVVGIAIWRSVIVANWRGQICSGFFRIAFALAVGLVAGRILSPIMVLGVTQPITVGQRTAGIAFELLIYAWLLIALFVFIRWIGDAAASWGTQGNSQAQARRQAVIVLAVVAVVLTLWYGLLQTLLGLGQDAFVLIMNMFNPLFTASSFAGIFVALFMAMWILPILPLLIRPNHGQPNRTWLSLDAGSGIENTALIENSSLRSQWRLTLVLAIGASIVFGLVHLLMRVSARALFSESVRGSEEFLVTFYSATFIIGALFQCGLAIIVALVVKRLGVTHALVAAFVMALSMGVMILSMNLAYGGTVGFEFARGVFFTTANLGMWLVLPAATIVATVAERVRYKQHTMSVVRGTAT
jgi:Zn-dependent protease with chaperone function